MTNLAKLILDGHRVRIDAVRLWKPEDYVELIISAQKFSSFPPERVRITQRLTTGLMGMSVSDALSVVIERSAARLRAHLAEQEAREAQAAMKPKRKRKA